MKSTRTKDIPYLGEFWFPKIADCRMLLLDYTLRKLISTIIQPLNYILLWNVVPVYISN
jgi:hypothetical protein